MGNINVLHLISANQVFGAERVALSLCKALPQYGVSAYLGVVDSFSKDNEVIKSADSLGIDAFRFLSKSAMDFSSVKDIKKLIKRKNIHIIHSHNYKSNFIAMLSRQGIKWIVTEHTWGGKDIKARLYEFIDKRIILFSDRVVGVSENLLDDFNRAFVPKKKLALIYNGIDVKKWNYPRNVPVSQDKIVLGFVGRWSYEKNVLFLLEAFARARRLSNENLFMNIVGAGPLEGEILSKIEELSLRDVVNVMGKVSPEEMANFYSSIDGLVLMSRKEGLPMVVLEALAMGRPVIGSFHAIRSVRDDFAARLVDIGNINATAGELARFANDIRSRGGDMSEKVRHIVEQGFSEDKMAADYSALYEEALG